MKLGRGGIVKELGDVPGAIGVVDQQAVAALLEPLMSAQESLGGGTLEKGPGRGVQRRAEEIIGGGVADIELDGGVKLRQVDQIGLEEERAFLLGRDGLLGQGTQSGDGLDRL